MLFGSFVKFTGEIYQLCTVKINECYLSIWDNNLKNDVWSFKLDYFFILNIYGDLLINWEDFV